jgi:hypothetical protein
VQPSQPSAPRKSTEHRPVEDARTARANRGPHAACDERLRVGRVTHVALEVGDVDEALEWCGRIFAFELRGRAGRNIAFIDTRRRRVGRSATGARRPATMRRTRRSAESECTLVS